MHATSCETVGDEALVAQAAAGDVEAFEELYRRHHVLARRLAQRITGNDDDARDAAAEAFTRVFGVVSSRGLRQHSSFRSYLLTTVRHVGIDKVRQRCRVEPTEEIRPFEAMSLAQGPEDATVTSEDGRLLLEAFRQLPQRSRAVLWMVDVERVPTRVAAKALGLTPGNVAQIAVRARTRLRHSYLQAHLTGTVESGCRFTVEHLGSFLDGGLCKASVTKLEGHLGECESCRSRVEELRDLGVTTRRLLFPLLLLQRLTGVFRRGRRDRRAPAVAPSADVARAVPAQSLTLSTHASAVVTNPAAVDILQSLGQSPVVHRLVAYVAAGTMAVGASSVALKSVPTDPEAGGAAVSQAASVLSGMGADPIDPGRGAGSAVVGWGGFQSAAPPPAPGSAGGGATVGGSLQGGSPGTRPIAASAALGGAVTTPGLPAVQPPAVAPESRSLPAPVTQVAGATAALPAKVPAAVDAQVPAGPSLASTALTIPPLDTGQPAPAPLLLPTPPKALTEAVPGALVEVVPSPSIPAQSPLTNLASSNSAPPPVSLPPASLDSAPLSTPPLSVPPVSAPVPIPVSTPPLSVPPVSEPVSVPLSTPPLSVPPVSAPVPVPVSTPPLSVPPVSAPVPVPVSTPPLSVPPVSAPVPVPVSTPPLSVPPASVPLSVPPVSVPVSAPPVLTGSPVSAPPLAALPLGPSLPLTAPLSTPTSGILP